MRTSSIENLPFLISPSTGSINDTRRDLHGRVEMGKYGGGLAYCYRMKKQYDANGETIKGDREISEDQATIFNRIFQEYGLKNKSPKPLLHNLIKKAFPALPAKHGGNPLLMATANVAQAFLTMNSILAA